MHNETVQVAMALEFKDKWLEQFYEDDKRNRLIPNSIENALFRKLEILKVGVQFE
jgi:proteic killer suppression protein